MGVRLSLSRGTASRSAATSAPAALAKQRFIRPTAILILVCCSWVRGCASLGCSAPEPEKRAIRPLLAVFSGRTGSKAGGPPSLSGYIELVQEFSPVLYHSNWRAS